MIAISSLGISFDDSFAQTNIELIPTANIDDSDGTDYELDGAAGITSFVINGKTYVAVAGKDDDGVQILNVTDPTNITAPGFFDDGTDSDVVLGEAWEITSYVIDSKTYVAVTAEDEDGDGVQILNVTDPTGILEVNSVKDSDGTLELGGASGITSFVINSKTYVAVTGNSDHGVQIIDVTDHGNITEPGSIEDSDDSSFELNGAAGITSFVIDNKTYVAVAGKDDDGVQILDVTDPGNIAATDSIDDMDGTFELDGAQGITVTDRVQEVDDISGH